MSEKLADFRWFEFGLNGSEVNLRLDIRLKFESILPLGDVLAEPNSLPPPEGDEHRLPRSREVTRLLSYSSFSTQASASLAELVVKRYVCDDEESLISKRLSVFR